MNDHWLKERFKEFPTDMLKVSLVFDDEAKWIETSLREGSKRMNRDEIMNMQPGRELDALVAEKVMGGEPWGPFEPSTDISAAMEAEETVLKGGHPQVCQYMRELKQVVGWDVDSLMGLSKLVHATPGQRCKAALLSLIQEDTP